jgi:hypothetical protein
MDNLRPEKPCGLNGTHDDSDIVIQSPSGPAIDVGSAVLLPVWSIDMAREFGRRGDSQGFVRWLCRQTSYLENRQRLQQEYECAAAGEELAAWKKAWRDAISPQLSTRGLEALRRALATDDKRLVQGQTTSPPPLRCVEDWQLEGGDPIVIALWIGDGYSTVGQAEEQWARLCCKVGHELGDPSGVRFFLNWWDSEARDVVRQQLLIEVDLALIGRLPQETEASTPLAKLLAASIRLAERKEGAA